MRRVWLWAAVLIAALAIAVIASVSGPSPSPADVTQTSGNSVAAPAESSRPKADRLSDPETNMAEPEERETPEVASQDSASELTHDPRSAKERQYAAERLEELGRLHADFLGANPDSGVDELQSAFVLALTSLTVELDAQGAYRETDGAAVHFKPSDNQVFDFVRGTRHYTVDLSRYPTFRDLKAASTRDSKKSVVDGRVTKLPAPAALTDVQRQDVEQMYTHALALLTKDR